jgi:fumarate reductase flavoprotein subunit
MLLADRHKVAGIDCSGCHKESSTKAVPTETCLGCHGPYEKLAEQTDKLDVNPHSSHLGERDCSDCHHSHKRSEDYCMRCHQFHFKVP